MEIFKFDKDTVVRHIRYELKTLDKFKEPLNYVIKQLDKHKNSLIIKSLDGKIDLNKIKERKGKNYHWSAFIYKNVTLVVRRYQQHLTIFTKVNKGVNRFGESKTEYGAFTLNTDFEKFGDKHDEMLDKYYDKPFTDLNVIVKDLLSMMIEKDGGVHWVWNSVSLKRPDHVEIKLAFSEEIINSVDDFIFCMEELDSIYLELFAENTMIQRLKEIKTGEILNENYTAGAITTTVKDDYFHSVGLELINPKRNEKAEFQDVYSLTRWYFEVIFNKPIYSYNGEIYIEGGEYKDGEPVAYKNIHEDNVTIFQDKFPKENFIPLKKY